MDWFLLDLRASVNLLPYLVYKQLILRKLQPTNLLLLLTGRSVKISKKIVEDVISKVDEFYFPADFVVLDTEPMKNPSSHSPVILDRPFLATANTIIRCRNIVMTLSFENMVVKINIFHAGSQPPTMDDHEEISMIDISISHMFEEFCYIDPSENCLAHFEQNFNIDEFIN